MKEHEAVFLKRQYLRISIVAGSIWFVFCLRANILTSKISNLLLPLGAERARGRESWYNWNYHSRNKFITHFRVFVFPGPRPSLICIWQPQPPIYIFWPRLAFNLCLPVLRFTVIKVVMVNLVPSASFRYVFKIALGRGFAIVTVSTYINSTSNYM